MSMRNRGLQDADAADGAFGGSAEEALPYRLATSLLLFGLLAEWLLPWTSGTDWAAIYHPTALLAVIGCVLAAGLFRLPMAVTIIFNSTLCLLCLGLLYKSGDQTLIDWLIRFPALAGDDVAAMSGSGLWAMSGELRTLLLLVGWALLAPALQALLWMRQTALGIAGLTVIYLIVLHVWLGIDIMGGLLRTVAGGLLLGAIVSVPRARRVLESGIRSVKRLDGKWLAGSAFLAVTIAGCGLLFAGGKETAMAPVGWTEALTQRLEHAIGAFGTEGGGSAAATLRSGRMLAGSGMTGYGFDDSELGAPLKRDGTIVFTARSPVEAYWRGESKTVYDGRGWSNDWSGMTLMPVRKTAEEASAGTGSSDPAGAVGVAIRQTVIWNEPAAAMPLLASGGSGRVTELIASDPRRKLGSYMYNERTDSLYASSQSAKVERYTVESVLPITDEAQLRALGEYADGQTASFGEGEASAAASAAQMEAELKPYLQLPYSLPGRVVALASEVAGAGATNRYDQVKATLDYLRSSYAYSLEDSAVPPAGTDFVDYFLFEQQKGYCVHFSSAMVVMLRTQGIPARWVKGFTAGTQIADNRLAAAGAEASLSASAGGGAKTATYTVSGSDAHAWVEVYFPGAGWVPFDPTPGFDGAASVSAAAAFGDAASDGGAGELAGREGSAAGEAGPPWYAELEAAAERAASGVARAADALAQAARSAVRAAAAEPAAASAAGAAALALALAAAAAAQRERLRLALALRRYGAAYAAGEAGRADAAAVRAADDAPPALAPRSGRRRVPAAPSGADARLRGSFAAVADALAPLLQRRLGARAPHRTARQYAAAAESGLAAPQQDALRRLTGWAEEARFGPPGKWTGAPSPSELQAALRTLGKRQPPADHTPPAGKPHKAN